MTVQCPKCKAENPDTKQFCGDCGTKLIPSKEVPEVTKTLETPREELTRGITFANRYEIIEELGRGGMGRVYRADDTKVKEEVALKLVKPEVAADKKTIERFRNELKSARKIRHKNVCQMFDLGEYEGIHFITMEYVTGEDLNSLIRRMKVIPTGTAVSITKQICEGLIEAHKLGIVHRDLKPSNIMIDKAGTARIMDFGIARSARGEAITGENVIIGTPDYMSPEQVDGKEVDQRSDIYSLGVVLFEMLTGKRPFKGDTCISVAMKHKSEAPPNPKWLNYQIPDSLSRLVLKFLEKDKERRYQTAEELLSALNALDEKKLHIPDEEEKKKSIVVLPFENLSPDPEQEYFCDGMTEEIISDLSNVRALRVISRSSAMTFKGTKKKIKEIAQEVNVNYVLEGSVRKAGDNLRITAQLIDGTTDEHLWAEKYSGTLDDVFDIQENVSRAVVESLRMVLMPSEERSIAARPLGDAQAYDSYIRARHEIARWTEDSLDRAVQQLEMAMDMVGDNAVLHAGLGYAYIVYFWGGFRMDEATLQKAAEQAKMAVELDPAVAEGHFVLGAIAIVSGEPQTSYNHFRKALSLNSNDSDTLFWMVQLCGFISKPEVSEPLVERLLETDPLSPNSYVAAVIHHIYSGNFEGAMEPARKAMQLDPKGFITRFYFFVACTYNHKLEELDPVLELWLEENPDHSWPIIVSAFVSAQRGIEIPIPEKTLNELWQDVSAAGHGMPALYSMLNKKEEALNWLERGFELGFFNYPLLSEIDPRFENIRGEPRFKKLMERVKHEWENFEV